MKILHSADWHIDSRNPRFERHVACLLDMIAYGVEQQVDAYIFAGDFAGLDAPHHLRTKEILSLIDLFLAACTQAPTIVIPGNHDEAEQFQLFEKISLHENFFLFPNPTHTTIETRHGRLGVVALPWLPKSKILHQLGHQSIRESNEAASRVLIDWSRRALETLGDADYRMLVAHYSVPGGVMGSVEVSTAHDVVFDLDALAGHGIDYAAFGHLHCRQRIGDQKLGYYSGSPVPIDFAETQAKGCNLIDCTPGFGRNIHFRRNNAWEMKTIHLDFNGTTIDGELDDSYANAYVRLNITIPQTARLLKKAKIFSDVEKKILQKGALGVKTNRLPARIAERPPPVFLSQTSITARLEAVMEEHGYPHARRQRLLAAFEHVRQRWTKRNAESGHSE